MTEGFTNNVLQPWVRDLSFMMQSVLMTAVRAPDTLAKTHPAKLLCRWYRRCILVCAFEKIIHYTANEPCGGKFTGSVANVDELAREYLINVDEIPHHYHLHLVHAAEIIGYLHPIKEIAEWWLAFYIKAVNDMHLRVETKEKLETRLSDMEEKREFSY